jgi:hypothetical protein
MLNWGKSEVYDAEKDACDLNSVAAALSWHFISQEIK